jgi:hypothetical protein
MNVKDKRKYMLSQIIQNDWYMSEYLRRRVSTFLHLASGPNAILTGDEF